MREVKMTLSVYTSPSYPDIHLRAAIMSYWLPPFHRSQKSSLHVVNNESL